MKQVPSTVAILLLGTMIPCLYGQASASGSGRVIPDREALIPRLVVSKPGKEQPVSISRAEVSARLNGILAETTVTLTFKNPNDRVLEGELYYPLPDEAALQGYALDINGRLVDGVPVTKEKARVVFEEEQRKNIDPGLVEWSGGNSFKTRIYPIPSQGTRTVRLRYTSILPIGDNGAPVYRLPLNFPRKLDAFKLRIESQDNRKPTLSSPTLSNFNFQDWQRVFVAESEWNNLSMTEDLVVSLPSEQIQGLENGQLKSGLETYDGETFAAVSLIIPPIAGTSPSLPSPDTIDIAWDASGSMVKADLDKTLDLLKKYFEQTADQDKTVRVFLLRNKLADPVPFTVSGSNAETLLKFLRSIRYDGGTGNFDSFLKADTRAGIRFVVTDGIVNLGATQNASSTPTVSVPTYALIAKSGADINALRRQNMNILNLTEATTDQALESMKYAPLTASAVVDGQPWKKAAFNKQEFHYGDSLVWTAVLPDGVHNVKLEVQTPDGKIVASGTANFDTASARPGTMLRSFYGQNMLVKLMLEPSSPATKEALSQLGQDYGIVTPGTSLLVLESLDQYLRYKVRPPASAPKERQLYDEAMIKVHTRKELEADQIRLDNLKAALNGWKDLTTWYAKDFPVVSSSKRGKSEEGDVSYGSPAAGMSVERARQLNEVDSAWETPAPAAVPVLGQEEAGDSFAEAPDSLRQGHAAFNGLLTGNGDLGRTASSERTTSSKQKAPKEGPSISVKAWNPDSPYLAALDSSNTPFDTYLKLKEKQGDSPGFYLDCSEWFAKKGDRETAIQILTNLAEMELENRSLMRVLAYKLRYLGDLAAAKNMFDKVRDMFPEEPQSYRDLALVLDEMGDRQGAFNTLKLVLEKPMHPRFRGIEQIVLVEMNRIIARAKAEGRPVDTQGLDPAFITPIATDIRVVINWDTDNSDMDLWATDRFGEKCIYSHNRTSTGGHLSRDVTDGYGPEEFMIRKAVPGNYKIEANYYGSRSQKMLAPVTLYAEVYTDYARPEEKRQTLVFRLKDKNDIVHIGDVAYSHEEGGSIAVTRDYQIKKGDTLESIAERELGDKTRATEIVTLNGWNPPTLPVTGTIIKLPAR